MNNLSQTERMVLMLTAIKFNTKMISHSRSEIQHEITSMLVNHGIEVKMNEYDIVTGLIVRDRVKFDRYVNSLLEYGNQFLSIRVEENRD